MTYDSETFSPLINNPNDYIDAAEAAISLACQIYSDTGTNPFKLNNAEQKALVEKLSEEFYNHGNRVFYGQSAFKYPVNASLNKAIGVLKKVKDTLDMMPEDVLLLLKQTRGKRTSELIDFSDIELSIDSYLLYLNRIKKEAEPQLGRNRMRGEKELIISLKNFLINEIGLSVPTGSRTAMGLCVVTNKQTAVFENPTCEAVYVLSQAIEHKITRSNVESFLRENN